MYIYLKDMAVSRVWSGVLLLKLSFVLSFEANLLALALVSHYVFIYHFTGLEVHFPGYRTPPSLRQRLGLPPLCAFSLWFYDTSARLNSFFTYVKYIIVPILWIQTTYNKSVYKYFSDDKPGESKRHALHPVCEGLHNLR